VPRAVARRLCAALLVLLALAPVAFAHGATTNAAMAWTEDLLAAYNEHDVAALERFAQARIGTQMLTMLGGPQRTAREFFVMHAGLGPLEIVALEGEDPVIVYTRGTVTGASLAIYLSFEEGGERVARLGFVRDQRPPDAPPPRAIAENQLAAAVDTYLRALAAHDLFSGVVLIARDGRPVYAGAVGRASRSGDPVTLDTTFPLASTSKMFTALAVLQLAEAGALDLDDTLAMHLPTLDARWADDVTLRHLLTHGSGLGSFDLAAMRQLKSVDAMLALPIDPPAFTPGTRYRYSNVGYVLLGAVVVAAGGRDFDAYLDEHVFTPAGMTRTGAPDLSAETPGVATGFLAPLPGGVRLDNLALRMHRGSPAGDFVATAGDLFRFGEALLAGELLNEPWLSEMMRTQRTVAEGPGVQIGYGFGLTVQMRAGVTSVGHGGGAVGESTSFELVPELGVTTVVLSNYDLIADVVAERLAEMMGLR
jgi:D-alanyl-D-alanine carboxypeptidase